ncbi:hypothetical protein ACEUZ9_004659 [Paracoccus litorisediminis]|uniref:hypothetical protein n=1 Tax=Paracoccus litorisediminis TaxID=2006130 RepID=UPI00373038A8
MKRAPETVLFFGYAAYATFVAAKALSRGDIAWGGGFAICAMSFAALSVISISGRRRSRSS